MGIYATIRCDYCNNSLSWEHVGKTHVISWARDKGWSVGKTIKCNECRKK